MVMKSLFICPPTELPLEKGGHHYPLGILYLASVLEKKGHQASAMFFPEKTADMIPQILGEIRLNSPDIVGMSCMTMNRTACFGIAKSIRKEFPSILIIMGGVHSTYMYRQILENFPIDVIVIGEAELTIAELFDALKNGKNLRSVKGIAFKDEIKGKVICNPPRQSIENLDSIPFPKHELFDGYIRETKTVGIVSSRGCPNFCSFCSTSVFWGRRWRARSAENVVDELEHIQKRFPYAERIVFHDDTFMLDNQRVIDICQGMIDRKLKFRWSCSGRVDSISLEMLMKMKEAGCEDISYGVESGSPKMLQSIDKNITLEQIENAISLTNKAGIKYYLFLMVGSPGETWETVKESAAFLKRLDRLDVNAVARLEIYPNTKVYEIAKKQGIIDDSFWLTDKTIPHYTFEHSDSELQKMALYIVEQCQLKKGLLNYMTFAFKYACRKPGKAMKYALMRLGVK